jgi:DNA-directed RNA polymerase specialized sigma24 family protein
MTMSFTIGFYSKEKQLNPINQWVETNYQELKLICQKISKLNDVDDLLHSCIEQLLLNRNAPMIGDKERLFFFARMVRNNWNSTTSKYYNEYSKFKFNEIKDNNIIDKEYEESKIDLDWVKNMIILHKKGDLWYYARLFELFIEEGCSVTNLARKTTIPLNSVSRDLNKYRRILRKLRDQHTKNE